jgi:hypothetical protein
MQEKTEQIKLSDIEVTRLPLGYKKIYLDKIPPLKIENKLMLYNRKYKFNTMQVSAASKPISKILK